MDKDLDAQRLHGTTVILAEDDDDAREVLTFALETFGARVVSAPCARAALALVDTVVPTALVSDIAMPDEDGFWLVKEMRRILARRGVILPAVACTAFARDEVLDRALAAGFQRYVRKPVDPLDLCAAVADAIAAVRQGHAAA